MIWDVFPFRDEEDILEIRLWELDPVVDRFVVVQSVETHAGLPKPLAFHPKDRRWRPWASKLSEVTLPAIPDGRDWQGARWGREKAPRHAVAEILASADPADLVLISDVDEIPPARLVAKYAADVSHQSWIGFRTACFIYYLNLRVRTRTPCIALAKVSTVLECGAQAIRHRYRRPPLGPIDGGWHFTSQGPASAIREKLHAFAHDEWDTPEMHAPGYLEQLIAERRNLFNPKEPPAVVVPPTELPDAAQRFPKRLLPW